MPMHPEKILTACLTILGLGLILPPEAAAQSRLQRGGVDVVDHEERRFWLDVTVGGVSLDGFDFDLSRATLGITPRFAIRHEDRFRLDCIVPVLWIPESYPVAVGPGDPTPELDSSFLLAPGVEWTFCTESCHRPSVFVGAGLRHDRGGEALVLGPDGVPVALPGSSTDDTTNPILTAGAAFQRPLRPDLTLRLEARLVTTFYDEVDVWLAGRETRLELDATTDFFLSVGLQYGF